MRVGSIRGLTWSFKECPSLLCADHSVSHLPLSVTPLPPQVLWRRTVLLTRGHCWGFARARGPLGEFTHHNKADITSSLNRILDVFNVWSHLLSSFMCYCSSCICKIPTKHDSNCWLPHSQPDVSYYSCDYIRLKWNYDTCLWWFWPIVSEYWSTILYKKMKHFQT